MQSGSLLAARCSTRLGLAPLPGGHAMCSRATKSSAVPSAQKRRQAATKALASVVACGSACRAVSRSHQSSSRCSWDLRELARFLAASEAGVISHAVLALKQPRSQI